MRRSGLEGAGHAYDNMSRLTPAMSDALARLSTGGGFATRKLYSDAEEMTFTFARPVILNGIEDIATKPDPLERSLTLELPKVEKRQLEDVLWSGFKEARPRILGALLDAVAGALKNRHQVPDLPWPRMADFARFVTAAESTLGMGIGVVRQTDGGLRRRPTFGRWDRRHSR